ncbi:uridine diphosphate glucose pyrophosphatase NUDT14 [Pristis pectinata]|uniref:uridine diphosphate glucose pyrophosphatase NUDT14 n=1 Tax=Pristis pectinata TaxID=685728 RepID=UPI00223D9142|nr:uridine diphosphate glucose pyrophosphatase NUDT14 [Pristis pectinata]
MESLSEVEVGPCRHSRFLRPLRVHYTQNGIRKEWDFMKTHDSVSVLIYHTTRDSFVLVKQFRPAVYMCEYARQGILPSVDTTSTEADPRTRTPVQLLPASVGITYELCAGIVDKPGLSLEEIAKEEIREECGYRVPVESLQKITSYRSGVGLTGSKHTMFYVEVSDDMHVGADGGNPEEGELIEVVHLPRKDWQTFVFNECIPKTAGVNFAFMWFQDRIAPRLQAPNVS